MPSLYSRLVDRSLSRSDSDRIQFSDRLDGLAMKTSCPGRLSVVRKSLDDFGTRAANEPHPNFLLASDLRIDLGNQLNARRPRSGQKMSNDGDDRQNEQEMDQESSGVKYDKASRP